LPKVCVNRLKPRLRPKPLGELLPRCGPPHLHLPTLSWRSSLYRCPPKPPPTFRERFPSLRHPLKRHPWMRRLIAHGNREAPGKRRRSSDAAVGKSGWHDGGPLCIRGGPRRNLSSYLDRHANGDWGEVDEHDRNANEYALGHGLQVPSAYTLSSGEKTWLITEADRSTTTILLPEEY
jgi:hypothetical protein